MQESRPRGSGRGRSVMTVPICQAAPLSLSIGLILRSRLNPSPRGLNHTDHCLPAGMNVNVLDRDLLGTLPAVAIERVEPP